MFVDLLLHLVWSGVYLKSPYLFLSIAAVPYYFELDRYLFGVGLESMTAFPLSFHYILRNLRAGRSPDRPEMIIVESIRWLLVMSVPDSEAHRSAMSGYCYSVLMMTILKWSVSTNRQIEFKYVWHLLWTVYILQSGSVLGVILHLLNIVADFRLASLLANFAARIPR